MALIWSKNDVAERPEGREIPRKLRPLDEVLPCLYIAQYGVSGRDLRERETEAAPGLFAVGKQTGGERPGVAPRIGLISTERIEGFFRRLLRKHGILPSASTAK